MTLHAHVAVRRGAFELDAVLDVPAGCVTAVLGPNGAGKSTLLRAVAGLLPLDAGHVRLGDAVWEEAAAGRRVSAHRRRVGVVFQDYRLFPHLSALENVAFGPRSTGTPKAAARATAHEWLGRLGLAGLEARRPAQLSGGQAQRVALARALATGPDALLLDEPLAALDAGTRDDVRQQLRSQLTTFAGPVLMVTHDLLDALTLADRAVVLADGRVVQEGTPDELLRAPAHPYVARLVGLNLWAGTVREGRLTLDAGDADARGGVPSSLPPGRVLVTCAPADVHLSPAGASGPPTRLAAQPAGELTWTVRVRSTARLAERVRVQLDGPPDVVADLGLPEAARLALEPGRQLRAAVATARLTIAPAPPRW